MKCVIKDCDNESSNDYLACDSKHGMMFKIIKDTLTRINSPEPDRDVINQWKWYISDELPTVGDAIYYSRFIK